MAGVVVNHIDPQSDSTISKIGPQMLANRNGPLAQLPTGGELNHVDVPLADDIDRDLSTEIIRPGPPHDNPTIAPRFSQSNRSQRPDHSAVCAAQSFQMNTQSPGQIAGHLATDEFTLAALPPLNQFTRDMVSDA